MKGPGSRNNWKVGLIGVPIFLTLLVLLVLAHDFWYIDMRCQSQTGNFYLTSDLSQRATALANLFRTQGWIVSGECGEQAKALFYSEELSKDERSALFDPKQVVESDLTALVQGLYGQQIDADDVKVLLSAKRLVIQQEHTTALSEYNKLIDANSANFALLYERAQLLNTLEWHEDTLIDLEQVVSIARNANEPVSEKIIEQSHILIRQDSELADVLAASKEEYPILSEMMSVEPTMEATVINTSDSVSPTLPPTLTIVMTPSSTAEPTLELLPTSTVSVTATIITPTITSDAITPTSTLTVPVTASTVPTITLPSTSGSLTPTLPPTSTPVVVSTQSVAPTQVPTQIPTQIQPNSNPSSNPNHPSTCCDSCFI